MKLQVTGFATVLKSNKLSPEVKEKILESGEGKVKYVQAKLIDAEGNEITLKGKLGTSSKDSLTARFAMKIESFELVELDAPDVKDKPSKEEREEAMVNELAQELLG